MPEKQSPTGKGGAGGSAAGGCSSEFSVPHFTRVSKPKPFYANNKKVGHVDGDTLYKQVEGDKHFLRQPPAIAFGLDSLRQAHADGVLFVEVTDKKNRRIYRASMETIFKHGREMQRGGFEKQIYLVLDRWQVRAVGQPAPDPKPDTPDDRPFTLPLFGGLGL